MRNCKTILIAFAFGVIMVVGISLCFSNREPSYNGRNLSAWLEDYVRASYRVGGSGNISFGIFDPAKAAAAREAIIAIGTNAIPFLVSKISQKPPFYEALHKTFPQLQRHRELQYREGESGFCILGASANSAVPKLCVLLGDDDLWVNSAAGECLVLIGKDSIPGLLSAIRAAPRDVRWAYLEELGTNATPAIPTLVQWTTDSDTNIVIGACHALGVLKLDSPLVVPALTKCLRSRNYRVSCFACDALAAYKSEARAAIPTLAGMLNDPDFNAIATWALKCIDPKTYATLR